MNLCILIPLLVGLICALLGYLLGKLGSKNKNNLEDINFWRSKNEQLENDLAECRANKKNNAGASGFSAGTSAEAALIPFNAQAATLAMGKKIKENDLTIVEGIGPKIQELFNENGINTWKQLSEASIEALQSYLDSKGQRYKVHKPGTWPMQAGMAYEGKWDALKKWQDENDYGKQG